MEEVKVISSASMDRFKYLKIDHDNTLLHPQGNFRPLQPRNKRKVYHRKVKNTLECFDIAARQVNEASECPDIIEKYINLTETQIKATDKCVGHCFGMAVGMVTAAITALALGFLYTRSQSASESSNQGASSVRAHTGSITPDTDKAAGASVAEIVLAPEPKKGELGAPLKASERALVFSTPFPASAAAEEPWDVRELEEQKQYMQKMATLSSAEIPPVEPVPATVPGGGQTPILALDTNIAGLEDMDTPIADLQA